MMSVKPDALRYAAGMIDKEWGSSGYSIERVEGMGHTAAVFVVHSDGSRFVIAANDMTGQWGHADGDDDAALNAALGLMKSSRYVDGQWRQPMDCGHYAHSEPIITGAWAVPSDASKDDGNRHHNASGAVSS